MNNPSFDYLDFVLLGFSSAMVSKTVSSGTDETSNYQNKMNTDRFKTSSLTQYRKRYPEMMLTGLLVLRLRLNLGWKFTWKNRSQYDRNRNRWTITVLFRIESNEFSSSHFQIDNSKALAINQMISMIYGCVRDTHNIIKNTSRVDDEPGELQ